MPPWIKNHRSITAIFSINFKGKHHLWMNFCVDFRLNDTKSNKNIIHVLANIPERKLFLLPKMSFVKHIAVYQYTGNTVQTLWLGMLTMWYIDVIAHMWNGMCMMLYGMLLHGYYVGPYITDVIHNIIPWIHNFSAVETSWWQFVL